VALKAACVLPWKLDSAARIIDSLSLFVVLPYFLINLIADSFASAPLLQKKTL